MGKSILLGVVVLWAVIATLGLIGTPQAQADSGTPPVEVHLLVSDDLLYMFECWPANIGSTPYDVLMVYINYPQGIASYECDYDGGTWIKKVVPYNASTPVVYRKS